MRKLSLIGHYKLDATPKMLHWSILDIGGVFGRVNFREDEKKKKNEERTFWRVFGWKRERGKYWLEPSVFSLGSPKSSL